MSRLVQLSVNTPSPSSELKVRVYYPVRLLTGPDLHVCRTYNEYLAIYGEDEFAQLLFSWNYELLCHRVSYVRSKSNLTKYLVDGEYKYYRDTGNYIDSTLIPPISINQTHINSLLLNINPNASSYNNFYFIIRTKMRDVSSGYVYSYSMGLFGCDYIISQGNGSYDEGEVYIKNHFDLEPISKSVFLPSFKLTPEGYVDAHLDLDSYEKTLNEFLIGCGFTIEDLGYNRILVSLESEDSSYSLYSDVVSVEELEDHYDRYYASIYRNHRILSISSKYPDAYSDIKVDIEKLDNRSYSVHVLKRSGSWSDEESYIVDPYSDRYGYTVRTFDEINQLSRYIDFRTYIDTTDSDFDPTGIYKLKGSFGFNDETLELNKVSSFKDEVIEGYYKDNVFYEDQNYTIQLEPSTTSVYEDLSTSIYYVWDKLNYLEFDYIESDVPQVDVVMHYSKDEEIVRQLGKAFPQALLLTHPGTALNNAIRVNPSYVYWYNFESDIPSGFAVMNLLLTTSYYDDFTSFRLPINQIIVDPSRYDLNIEKSDYGVRINSVYVNRFSSNLKYSIRSFVARAMFYRICMDISQTTLDGIHNYIDTNCSQIADTLQLDLSYRIENEIQRGSTYSADIMILVDNRLFTRFEIYTELNYEE